MNRRPQVCRTWVCVRACMGVYVCTSLGLLARVFVVVVVSLNCKTTCCPQLMPMHASVEREEERKPARHRKWRLLSHPWRALGEIHNRLGIYRSRCGNALVTWATDFLAFCRKFWPFISLIFRVARVPVVFYVVPASFRDCNNCLITKWSRGGNSYFIQGFERVRFVLPHICSEKIASVWWRVSNTSRTLKEEMAPIIKLIWHRMGE